MEQKILLAPVLRFAVLNQQGKLDPGHQNMTLSRKSRIIFSVEEPRGESFEPYQLTIWVSHTDNKKTVLESYDVTRSKEILQGKHGYLSFLLPTKGTYEFSGTKNINGDQVELKGFRLYVD